MTTEQCCLCGAVGPSPDVVAHGLIRWRDGNPRLYGSGPRCRDHDGCRRRVIEAGEEWPVVDGRPPRGMVHERP